MWLVKVEQHLIVMYKVDFTLKYLDITINLNEIYWAVLTCGVVYYAVQGWSSLSFVFCFYEGIS